MLKQSTTRMKIHPLSDVHLETGPYTIPASLDCDVIVAAGDIGAGTEGVEWLKTLNVPVVYVLGNHEYWSKKESPKDMQVVLRNLKTAAAGSNVHVLENEFTVIQGVRFFGATFWTNLGQFNPVLIDQASHMRDYHRIYCQSLYQDKDFLLKFFRCAKRYCALMGREEGPFLQHLHVQYVETGRFHPFTGYLLNQRSWDLIQREILNVYPAESLAYSNTVIVTHHHPSYQSLRFDGVSENELFPDMNARINSSEPIGQLYKAAAYASDLALTGNIDTGADAPKIAAWLCGHLHRKLDYAFDGARLACNPRGYHVRPLNEDRVQNYALFGPPVSQKDIEASRQRFSENPFWGDGIAFDPNFIVNLGDGITPSIKNEIARHVPELQQWHTQIQELAACLEEDTGTVACAMKECIETRLRKFNDCLIQLDKLIQDNTGASLQLFDARLTYRMISHYALDNLEPPGLREETRNILALQNTLIQKLTSID